ncbi:MAG: hypothetical protein JST40_12820 [Armatimonadetes bacterium]|nr:hypothetical protein [Armatimonadota bacterium]
MALRGCSLTVTAVMLYLAFPAILALVGGFVQATFCAVIALLPIVFVVSIIAEKLKGTYWGKVTRAILLLLFRISSKKSARTTQK